MEVASYLRIKARATSDQIAHLAAKSFVNAPKEKRSGIQTEFSKQPVQAHQQAQPSFCKIAAISDFVGYAFVNQVKKLRYHGEGRYLAFAKCSKQFGRIQSFEIDDASTGGERQQQVRHLRQRMK